MKADVNGHKPGDPKRSNRVLLGKLALVVIMMFGFGYALVPFYEQICKATGLRDIAVADTVANTQVDASRTVRVELDAPGGPCSSHARRLRALYCGGRRQQSETMRKRL